MDKFISVEHSIHYAANDYSGKIINFDDLTPIFIGYKKNKISKSQKAEFSKRFCYVIHLVAKGTCYFNESGVVHKAEKDSVFIAKPHVPVAYDFEEGVPTDYAWIGFYGNFAKKLDNVQTLHKINADYFSQIVRLLDIGGTVYAEPVMEILFNILTDIFNSSNNKKLVAIKDYLDKNYMNHVSIDKLAAQFSYNRTYLSQLFKKQYGYSLKEYLINKRLTASLDLILEGKSIAEVAYLVGYNNPYNFSNSFKAKYGVSPNKYLKKDSFKK